MSEKTSDNKKKVTIAALAAVGLLGAGLGGAGLQALFSDSKSMEDLGEYQSGTIQISEDFTKNSVADLTVKDDIVNLAAGDTTYRFFDVENTGTLGIGRLDVRLKAEGELADSGTKSNDAYDGDLVNGDPAVGAGDTPLHVGITACVDGDWSWDAAKNTPGVAVKAPTCSGTVEEIKPTEDVNENMSKTIETGYTQQDAPEELTNMISGKDLLNDGSIFTIYNSRTQVSDDGKEALPLIAVTEGDTFLQNENVKYMMTFHLPKEAKNEYQNTRASIDVTVNAIQRDSGEFETVAEAEAK